MTVLVTAAHGNQGRLLLPKLAKAGLRVRALRGSGPASELLRSGAAEALVGDAADPGLLREALAGVRTVYHVGRSAHPRERDMGMAVIDAAFLAGVSHFVYSSVLHPILSAMGHHALKRDIEERLVSSGLNFTILQPADYMQVVDYKNAFATGKYTRWWSIARREQLVDLEDVTGVAAKVLREGRRHFGATYPLCSGDCLNGHEIAAAIGRAMGRDVEGAETSPEGFLRSFFNADPHDPAFEYPLGVLRGLNSWYGRHDFVGNPNVLTWLLGREPTTFEQMVAREYAGYGASVTH